MNTQQLSFKTPVIKAESNFLNFVERYTWFGGDVCQIVLEGPEASLGQIVTEESSCVATACKIATMLLSLGTLLLVALAIKAISRCLSNRIIVAPSILTQPYVSPNLIPPNPQIEAIRIEQSKLDIPFKQALFLRAQTLGTKSPYVIEPSLLSEANQLQKSVTATANRIERQYLLDCSGEETLLIYRECPAVEQVLVEIMALNSIRPNPAPQTRTQFQFADPSQLPLHLRPGGHVLGGN